MLFTHVHQFITRHNILPEKSHCILGLSGGADSVFLFHYLRERLLRGQGTFAVAHLDHEWRLQSVHDAEFCAALAQKHEIPFYLQNLTFYKQNSSDITPNGSSEEYARRIRRLFFESVARQENTSYIALGHHADDNYENFFIRLARGTTPTGLCSIKPRNGLYIHPLLSITKREIIDYLIHHKIDFCHDHTNTDPRYLRNRVRTILVPALIQTDPRFHKNTLRTINACNENESLVQEYVSSIYHTVIQHHTRVPTLMLNNFKVLSNALQKRIIIHWLVDQKIPCQLSDSFVKEIIRFLLSPHGGTHHINKKVAIYKKNSYSFIVKN